MLHQFKDFEHQDQTDLEYGEQLPACQRLLEKEMEFEDHSITKDWTPDED